MLVYYHNSQVFIFMRNRENDFNKNLKKLTTYKTTIVAKGIKRMHANESGKPIFSKNILMKDVDNLNYYPEEKYALLIKQASKFYNIQENKIIPVNGSDEGIDLLVRTCCNYGDNVLVLNPGFSMYSQYATAFGLETISFDLTQNKNNFSLDIDGLIKTAQKNKPKIIFISNPLANVGSVVNKTDLLKIVKTLTSSVIVIDEAYIDFTNEDSMLSELEKYNNLVILRTMSKFFGLAGIRLGFIFSNFTDEILKIKSPYNVNQITCQIGINVFQNINKTILEERKKEFNNKRVKLIKWLKQFKEVETIFSSETNFICVKLNCNADVFADKLAKKYKIKIKTMNGEYENYCRISVL